MNLAVADSGTRKTILCANIRKRPRYERRRIKSLQTNDILKIALKVVIVRSFLPKLLHLIDRQLFAGESPGSTLQPTALVNEAWLKMRGSDGRLNVPDLEGRTHFYAIAVKVMRQILVDHARTKKTAKRGGEQVKMSIDKLEGIAGRRELDVLALDEALQRLETVRPRVAKVVELRFFGACTIPETAAAIGVSPETVKGDWRFAKAWLRRELNDDG
ncbi:MAG: sigma-70 family RNA polymerase sigma factor [Planctomycetes bacterium]|nr:sigma-70 family RNA polymerase sigma factor [Planctomycetota bacterium]